MKQKPEIIIMDSEAKFAEVHRKWGGSSMAAALFDHGYQDMPSRWSLYAHFRGELDDVGPDEETNARVRLGKFIEPAIAQEVIFRTGWDLLEGYQYHSVGTTDRIFVCHDELPIGCTADRYVREHEDGPGLIELKNRDYLQWLDSYTDDDASMKDRIQLAHQFLCHPEIQWGAIAALVGGNDLKVYKYKRDDLQEIIDDVLKGWSELWEAVNDGIEPPLTGQELPNWLRAHMDRLGEQDEPLLIPVGTMVRNPEDRDSEVTFDEAVETYLDAKARRSTYEKIEKEARAAVVQKLDERSNARSNRYRIRCTYSKVSASVVTLPKEMQEEARRLAQDDLQNPSRQMEAKRFLEIASTWEQETRKAGVRLTLKFDDDPMDQQDRKPTQDELKAAMDAQRPLDQ